MIKYQYVNGFFDYTKQRLDSQYDHFKIVLTLLNLWT